MKQRNRTLTLKSKTAAAIRYASGWWPALVRHGDDGELEIGTLGMWRVELNQNFGIDIENGSCQRL